MELVISAGRNTDGDGPGWWSTWAERLDDAAVRLWSFVLRRQIEVGGRGEDFAALMSGWWLVVSCVLATSSVLAGPDSWPATIAVSLVLAVPAGLMLLRGVLDAIGRSPRYTRGGWRAAAGYAVALAGALAALQP
jgi:hypothetical protein